MMKRSNGTMPPAIFPMGDPLFDKYRDKATRFVDKGTHYELYLMDDFVPPSSGNSFDLLGNTILTDVIQDMQNADHRREIHVFVASFGGDAHALNIILHGIRLFRHRVGINLGMAYSCGWMTMFACEERYASRHSTFMYHEMSSDRFGKIEQNRVSCEFERRWFDELLSMTDTKHVLTKEELSLGQTSEVWLTGAQLIEREAVMDYSLYLTRVMPMRCEDAYAIDDKVFLKSDDGEGYVQFVRDKSVKKCLRYCDLVNRFNEDEE